MIFLLSKNKSIMIYFYIIRWRLNMIIDYWKNYTHLIDLCVTRLITVENILYSVLFLYIFPSVTLKKINVDCWCE